MTDRPFIEQWRRAKSSAFDLNSNSTGGGAVRLSLWGRPTDIYINANLSIYSAQACNAGCRFCVEELRPASRGTTLAFHKTIEPDDNIYFHALEEVLTAVTPICPTISVTGGEPSRDYRLPTILTTLRRFGARKLTVTTNGSGLLGRRLGRRVIDWIADTGVAHLNISRAHPDHDRNARLMRYREGLSLKELKDIVRISRESGIRVRLSCVLLRGGVDSLTRIREYLAFADSIGVDNVVFRQLMLTDPHTVLRNFVVRYSDRKRVGLEGILDEISDREEFTFQKQIMGYYYYVEVWKYANMDVVFEEADLARLEIAKRAVPEIVQELVFHPNARLASTWQPWDGVLGPFSKNVRELSFISATP